MQHTNEEREAAIKEILTAQHRKEERRANAFAFVGVVAFAVFVVAAIVIVIHSLWFALTHIHMTRLEMVFAPENRSFLKVVVLAGSYGVFLLCNTQANK